MTTLLVTNDFPPKQGGIQNYLWELWRRLPPERAHVLTTPWPRADEWDARQPFSVRRIAQRWALPTPIMRRQIDRAAEEIGADLVLLDPALPVGRLGPSLERPYGVILHGAEVTIPARTAGLGHELRRVLEGAAVVIAAGDYPASEAQRLARTELPITVIPPGVDTERFLPLSPDEKLATRQRLGLPTEGQLVVSISRLVPRKGLDKIIPAVASLAKERPGLHLAVGGRGRERRRLVRLAELSAAPVTMLGRVAEDDLPGLYGCGDVFSMMCRVRWGGLEQEGFGIVFLEAAACEVAQVAGRSGGAADAVEHERTGLVVENPDSIADVAAALGRLLDDDGLRGAMGTAGRTRAVEEFSYDLLASRLEATLW